MGLFSIFSKNKQDSGAQDSGHFSREDDDYGRQARAKRPSHANEAGQGGSRRSRSGGDPMLPEKKRARRRLVGAVALALAAAVGLPMLLDSEPRPLAGDVAIQIPAKDKAPPLPMPSNPVPINDSVDQGEEIIAPSATPSGAKSTTPAATPPSSFRVVPDKSPDGLRTEPEVKMAKPEPKAEHKPEPKPDTKPEPKPAEHKPEVKAPEHKADKPVEKPAPKKEEKVVTPRPKDQEAARALALLEGKAAAKPAEKHEKADKVEDKPQPEASQRFVVQAAALASQEKVEELQARLRAAGVSSYTQKSGNLIRVRIGPFGSREEADRAKAKLGGMGLAPTVVPG